MISKCNIHSNNHELHYSCVGDSGSALMRDEKSIVDGFPRQYKLIGVVSFGPRLCGTKDVPGVYTRVRSYLDWILENVKE